MDESVGAVSDLPKDALAALALRTNILLVGEAAATERVLDRLRVALSEPTFTWHGGARLALPQAWARCTLLLRDVDTLRRRDQRRLEDWFEKGDGSAQVISTTARPLHSLVLAGSFSDRLYYHLNTILIDLRPNAADADV